MLEIQFMFLEQSRHQSLSLDMYAERSGSGAVHIRLWNQNHLRFTDPELKLTPVHVDRNSSRNRNHQNILLEGGVKVATSCIRTNICKLPIRSGHQSLSRFW